ncbi:MAG: alpha-hydroxy-acid oxidizing protein [Verrucomicrobia bacterium]|nr:alpha-hydroxy-acid oxidizing protein [Verrucomicrobiota bacterium]
MSRRDTLAIISQQSLSQEPVHRTRLTKSRAISASLVKRAEVAGCKAIVFTVDVPVLGRRERDVRNQFKLPDDISEVSFVKNPGLRLSRKI